MAFGFVVTEEGKSFGRARIWHRGERTGGETDGEKDRGGGVGSDWE